MVSEDQEGDRKYRFVFIMGKKGLSDKVRSKRKEKAKQQPNPFEVKVNKVKHVVVNKKVQSWEKGAPGVSRSKAIKKRKNTLLKELHHMKKSNMLLDKRFGEGDDSLTADEKMVQRFALEKKKQLGKGDFNLNEEEEVLTHYGQSLAENLQDTIGSDSETEENSSQVKTGDLQFGGFSKDDTMSWKDKMNEVIADSKKLKFERQAEKEKTVETTNQLDSNWTGIIKSLKKTFDNQAKKKKTSSFMQLFHNLMMEQKSKGASDKLQTDEEKAKAEAEELQRMEEERLARMRGVPKNSKPAHVSADDLDSGLLLDIPKRVSFFEPKVDSDDEEEDKDNDNERQKNNDDQDDNQSDGEEEDCEDGDDDDDDSDGDGSTEDSDYSDLCADDDSDDEEESSEIKKVEKSKEGPKKPSMSSQLVKPVLKKTEKPIVNHEEKVSSIPYTFKAPGNYEELESLLHGHGADEQALIVSRLRKCHHPSLAEGNKDKLEKIHLYLLQYFGEVVKKEPVDTKLVRHLTSSLWELTQVFPESTAAALQKLVVERQTEYADEQKQNGRGAFVGIETLLYLQLIEKLFPTSDYRHPVTTPAFHFISQMLAECCVKTGRDVVKGLFLCALALKYVNLSKRYVPEVITFLHGLLVLATNGENDKSITVFPPLRAGAKICRLLQVQGQCNPLTKLSLSELLYQDPSRLDNDDFSCGAVTKSVALLLECLTLWEDLPCLWAVMRPMIQPLSSLPEEKYPETLKNSIQVLKSKICQSETFKLRAMQQASKKPEPLKLFEPKFDEFWTGKRKKGGPNREVNERQRLNHKYKREMKAAMREIKRDNEVLARHQLDVAIRKDTERKRKTKDLFNSLANQEGDYNAIKRKK